MIIPFKFIVYVWYRQILPLLVYEVMVFVADPVWPGATVLTVLTIGIVVLDPIVVVEEPPARLALRPWTQYA